MIKIVQKNSMIIHLLTSALFRDDTIDFYSKFWQLSESITITIHFLLPLAYFLNGCSSV